MPTSWMYLPVPSQDHDELAALVAQRRNERGEPANPDVKDLASRDLAAQAVCRAAFERYQPWPDSALEQLAADKSLTAKRWAEVITAVASKAAELGDPLYMMPTEAVPEHTTLTVSQWQHACRRITRILRTNYDAAPTWPSGRHEGSKVHPMVLIGGREMNVRDQLYIGVPEEQATRWLHVVGPAS